MDSIAVEDSANHTVVMVSVEGSITISRWLVAVSISISIGIGIRNTSGSRLMVTSYVICSDVSMTIGLTELTCLNVILVASLEPSCICCRCKGEEVSTVPDSIGSVNADFAEMVMMLGVSGFCDSIVTMDVSVNSTTGCCMTTGSDAMSRGTGSGGTMGTEHMRLVVASGILISTVLSEHALHG